MTNTAAPTAKFAVGDKVYATKLNGSDRRYTVLEVRFFNQTMGFEYLTTNRKEWINESWLEAAND